MKLLLVIFTLYSTVLCIDARHQRRRANRRDEPMSMMDFLAKAERLERQGMVEPTESFDDANLNGATTQIRQIISDHNNLAATFIRLSFHDCVGIGGCNGCINVEDNIENMGLERALDEMEPVITSWESNILSRADIVALAGLVAANVSQSDIDFLEEFQTGRINCENAGDCALGEACFRNGPDVASDFPSADLTTHELTAWFADNFNFTTDQTVAIMGAHTMGDASPRNSGFQGQDGWTRDENRLDNDFYRQIVGVSNMTDDFEALADNAPNWVQIQVQSRQFPIRSQWVRVNGRDGGGRGDGNRGGDGDGRGDGRGGGRHLRSDLRELQEMRGRGDARGRGRGNGRNGGQNGRGGDRLFMLNADIALVRDLDGEFLDATGLVNCTFRFPEVERCPLAMSTLGKAAEYRSDNLLWLNDFSVAFSEMLSTGLQF